MLDSLFPQGFHSSEASHWKTWSNNRCRDRGNWLVRYERRFPTEQYHGGNNGREDLDGCCWTGWRRMDTVDWNRKPSTERSGAVGHLNRPKDRELEEEKWLIPSSIAVLVWFCLNFTQYYEWINGHRMPLRQRRITSRYTRHKIEKCLAKLRTPSYEGNLVMKVT